MKELRKYANKFGIHEVINGYGEYRITSETSIVFLTDGLHQL